MFVTTGNLAPLKLNLVHSKGTDYPLSKYINSKGNSTSVFPLYCYMLSNNSYNLFSSTSHVKDDDDDN